MTNDSASSVTLTFAHSGTVVNHKGGNIFVISHLENSLRVCSCRVKCCTVAYFEMKGLSICDLGVGETSGRKWQALRHGSFTRAIVLLHGFV
jgi:hypothetical protein